MSQELIFYAQNNLGYFKELESGSYGTLVKIFQSIIEIVAKSEEIVSKIKSFAPKYDFDDKSPGNGYRSFDFMYTKAVKKTTKLCQTVQAKRESFFFRKSFYEK